MMKDWVPFFEALVWPALLAVVLLRAKAPLRRLLKAIEERIVSGAEFEASTSGIKVGAVPKMSEVRSASAQALAASGPKAAGVPTPGNLYLVHTARRDRDLDKGELRYFRVRIYLDADDPTVLDEVSEVIYYLHETFTEPIRVSRDRQNAFEVRTIVWGEFNVAGTVRFEGGREVTLERYLDI
jgi:hypothetical protein